MDIQIDRAKIKKHNIESEITEKDKNTNNEMLEMLMTKYRHKNY